MTVPDGGADRRAELADALASVRERIAAAARTAGREPAEVGLLAVTKTWPAEDVALLTDLGLVAFGENKEQEGAAKAAALATLRPGVGPQWRVVGRLQRNKARSVARWAHAVDSVDSARLVDALERAAAAALDAEERRAPLEVLVQISVDGDPRRGGTPVDEVPALTDRVAGRDHLRLGGVMAVAPREVAPEEAFATVWEVAQRVRVGTALLGRR